MKKMLFACTLILGGMIGMAGCLIACTQVARPGTFQNALNTINTPAEFGFFGFFLLVTIIGLRYGIKLLKSND